MLRSNTALKALLVLWCYVLFSANVAQALVPFPIRKPSFNFPSFDFTVSKVACSTIQGTGAAVNPLPTQYRTTTKYFTNTIQVGRAPKTTITPAPVTVTSTATQTVLTTSTDVAVTDTLTVTTTPSVTQTDTATTTQTITVDGQTVTVTQTSTVTVPTNDNFTPLASQIVAAGYQPYRRALPTIAADRQLLARANKDYTIVKLGKQSNLKNKSVACNKVVEVVKEAIAIGFLQKTRTITAAPQTTTQQTTVTTTSTVTVAPPHVSVTETSTAPAVTSTISTTVTQTETVSTSVTASATATTSVYDACSTNNVIGAINSQGIGDIGYYPAQEDVASAVSATATECCTACQADTNCQAFFYLVPSGYCYTLTLTSSGTCPASYIIYPSSSTSPGSAWVAGNGVCGRGTF